MMAQERYKIILSTLEKEGIVKVASLCKQLSTTMETIRRDLSRLEKDEKLKKVHGGAILLHPPKQIEISFNIRNEENIECKKKLARLTRSFISESDTVMVDASSTTHYLVDELLQMKHVIVITNSLVIYNQLILSELKVVGLGGDLDKDTFGFTGHQTLEALDNLYSTSCFISCHGLDMDLGIMDLSKPEALIKEKMLTHSTKNYLLVDHTKFDRRGLIKIGSWDAIDCIITDTLPSEAWCDFFEQRSIPIVYPDMNDEI